MFVQTLSTRFVQDFEFRRDFATDACLVEAMKFNFGRDSEARFGQDFEY